MEENQFPIALDKARTPWSDVLVLSTGPLRYITQMSEENYVVMKTGLSTFFKKWGAVFSERLETSI